MPDPIIHTRLSQTYPLTDAQVDANFTNLKNAVVAAQETADSAVSDLLEDDGTTRVRGTWWGGVVALVSGLATTAGSSLMGYIHSFLSSVGRSVEDRLRDEIHVFDFLTAAEKADVRAFTGALDVSAGVIAAMNETPVGGTLVFQRGGYRIGTHPTLSKSINIRGSSVIRAGEIGANDASGVLWFYTGVDRALLIQRSAADGVALNGINIDGIEFRASVPGAAVRGIEFDANGGSIFGVKFSNVHVAGFGKSAVGAFTPGAGDVWDITFDSNCSAKNAAGATEHLISFEAVPTGGAGTTGGFGISIRDAYLQNNAANVYAAKAAALLMSNGIVDCTAVNSFGTYGGGGTSIVGTKYEAYGQAGTHAIKCVGSNIVLLPGNVASFATGMKLSCTQAIVSPTMQANTVDIEIEAGGSRAGIMIFGANMNIVDNRYIVDNAYEVFIFANSDWAPWTPQLRFGNAFVGMTGTMTGKITKIGRQINGTFEIALTAKGSSTGAATITGLGFTVGETAAVDIAYHANLAAPVEFQCRTENTLKTITLGKSGGVTTLNMTDADFTNTTMLFGSFSYSI